jgi:hypothetical protein
VLRASADLAVYDQARFVVERKAHVCGPRHWLRIAAEFAVATVVLPSRTMSHLPVLLQDEAERLPATQCASGNRLGDGYDMAAVWKRPRANLRCRGKRNGDSDGDTNADAYLHGSCSFNLPSGLATKRCHGSESAGSQLQTVLAVGLQQRLGAEYARRTAIHQKLHAGQTSLIFRSTDCFSSSRRG